MSKWVEVPVTILKTYAVEINDDETIEDAQRYVREDAMGDDVEFGDCLIADDARMGENIKRCADERLSL